MRTVEHLRETIKSLPTAPDLKPNIWVMVIREEGGVCEVFPVWLDDVMVAAAIARGLVETGFCHAAWIVADISGRTYKGRP